MNLSIESILNWFENNAVVVQKGSPMGKTLTNTFLLDYDDYVNFLGFCSSINPDVIVFDQFIFDLNDQIFEELDLGDDLKIDETIQATIERYNQFDGNSYRTYFYCNKNCFSYLYILTEDWYNDFISEIEEHKKQNLSIIEISRKPQLDSSRMQRLIEQIACSPEFYAIHTRPNKIGLFISQILSEEKISMNEFDIDLYYIEKQSLKLFNSKYFIQHEQFYKEQVMTLKSRGKTKKAIISTLKITEGIFDNLLGG